MTTIRLTAAQAMVRWLSQWYAARSFGARAQLLTKFRPGMLVPVIGLLKGLTDPVIGINMGQTAENLAARFGISRTQMDFHAMRSHQRTAAALDASKTAVPARSSGVPQRAAGMRSRMDLLRSSSARSAAVLSVAM